MRRSPSWPIALPFVAGLLATALSTSVLGAAETAQVPSPTAAGTTTIVLVRHAEKLQDGTRDPGLTAAGAARAEALAELLAGADVRTVYATEYQRTRLTAAPTASRFGLEITPHPRGDADAATWARAFAPELLAAHAGATVLVVSHSDTTPALVEALTGRAVEAIAESVYDRLFVVIVDPGGKARLIEARYGAPAP